MSTAIESFDAALLLVKFSKTFEVASIEDELATATVELHASLHSIKWVETQRDYH